MAIAKEKAPARAALHAALSSHRAAQHWVVKVLLDSGADPNIATKPSAAVHTIVVSTMELLLIETLLLDFRKIPFTCNAAPFKQSSIVLFIVCVLGFYGFSAVVPALEREAFDSPFPFEELIVILFFVWGISLYAVRKSQTEHERRVIFHDVSAPAVETLDLTFRR
jgi:hypothetical protein